MVTFKILSVEPSSIQVDPGESFAVRVTVKNVTDRTTYCKIMLTGPAELNPPYGKVQYYVGPSLPPGWTGTYTLYGKAVDPNTGQSLEPGQYTFYVITTAWAGWDEFKLPVTVGVPPPTAPRRTEILRSLLPLVTGGFLVFITK